MASPSHQGKFNLKTICDVLGRIATKWFQIGIQLGIPHNKLLEFAKSPDPLSAVINYWLSAGNVTESVCPVSWNSIVTMLKSEYIGEPGLAEKISKDYCTQKDFQVNEQDEEVKHKKLDKGKLTLKSICGALKSIKHRWLDIGIQLGIPLRKLKEFKKEDDPLATVIDYWLRETSGTHSWQLIVAMLKSKRIGEPILAGEISRKYCQQERKFLKTICDVLGSIKHKWFKIGIQLGIPRSKLQEFKTKSDPFSAVIDYWLREMNSYFSWQSIVTMLKSKRVGEPRLAEEISRKYCQQEGDHPSDTSLSTLPYFEQCLEQIHRQYDEYVECILTILQEKKIAAERLASFLLDMNAFVNDSCKVPVLSDMRDIIRAADSNGRIFDCLCSEYCSFIDFDILQEIHKEYFSTESREGLNYPERFENFSKQHKIKDFLKLKLKKVTGTLKKCFTKLNIKITECFDCLRKKQNKIAKILGLHPYTLQFSDIGEGSVQVTWLIPAAVAAKLFTLDTTLTEEQLQMLREASVLQFECNGFKFNDSVMGSSEVEAPQTGNNYESGNEKVLEGALSVVGGVIGSSEVEATQTGNNNYESGNEKVLEDSLSEKLHLRHPGVVFFYNHHVTWKLNSSAATYGSIDDFGVSLSVPANSLSSPIYLSICPCFSGPFELPDGYESASPAYLIYSSQKEEFQKEVTFRMHHYARLQSEENCEDMVFLTASSTPEYRESGPVYVFKEVQGVKGVFRHRDQVGEVKLKHFCFGKLAHRLKGQEKGNWLYSARLYRNGGSLGEVSAVFCMCLHHPMYIKHCNELIIDNYTGISAKEEGRSQLTAQIVDDKVEVYVTNPIGLCIDFDRTPTLIMKRDVDMPEIQNTELIDYPPRLLIYVQKKSPATSSSELPVLHVQELNKECCFHRIPIVSSPQSGTRRPQQLDCADSAASKTDSSTSPPTFEDYAGRVSSQDLKKEIDHQLYEIADLLRNWEVLAQSSLGLTEQQISDIQNNPARTPQLKRRDALSEWKRMYSFKATYGALLHVCVQGGETDCARKIVELLGGSMDSGGVPSLTGAPTPPPGPGVYYSSQSHQPQYMPTPHRDPPHD